MKLATYGFINVSIIPVGFWPTDCLGKHGCLRWPKEPNHNNTEYSQESELCPTMHGLAANLNRNFQSVWRDFTSHDPTNQSKQNHPVAGLLLFTQISLFSVHLAYSQLPHTKGY